MSQAMTTQARAATTQAQAMLAQDNREVVPRTHQHVASIASHICYLTCMNPTTLYNSKVEEVSQEFIDEVYKILLGNGVVS